MENLKTCWTDDTANSFIEVAEVLERFAKNLTRQDLDKVYCKGPDNVGRLVIPIKEVYLVINFLRTIKDMEEIGKDE